MPIAACVLLALILVFALSVFAFVAFSWAPDRPVDALRARWASGASRFVALDGMQIHVRDEGPRDDPVPIVLLHGTGSSLHTWDGWAQRLQGARRVIRIDRPGFGLTGPDPAGDYSMLTSARRVLRLLDGMKVGRFAVAGNSSGGRLAWQLALEAPARVERLVLVAAGGYPRRTPLPMGLRMAQSPWLGALMSRVLPRSMVEKGVKATYGDPSLVTPAVVERSYELTLRAGNRLALGETLRQDRLLDNSSRIREIVAPTVILWGDRDTVIPPADAQVFKNDIGGSQLVMFPELGHLPQEEDPAATLAAAFP